MSVLEQLNALADGLDHLIINLAVQIKFHNKAQCLAETIVLFAAFESLSEEGLNRPLTVLAR